ncbi:hypothetical protein GCM10009818_05670 [Nakamurella flavida]
MIAALGLLAAAAVVWPALFGLSTTPGFLHLVSFRGPVAAAGLVAAGVAAVFLNPWRRPSFWRTLIVAMVLVVGLGNAGTMLVRGWAGSPVAGSADLVVVSYNTEVGGTTADEIAALVRARGADMVSLPETSEATARRAAELLAAGGRGYQVLHTQERRDDTSSTSLLVADSLGVYALAATPSTVLGTVRAEPVGHDGPTLVAVHTGAPVPAIGYDRWAQAVATGVAQARDTPNAIVAGDFNATMDHAPMRDLGDYVDAATEAGRGAEGTWPSTFPVLVAAPIDHVLVNPAHYRVLSTQTVVAGGSDHRALIARLAAVPAS